MERTEIAEKVRKLISDRVIVAPDKVTPEAKIVEDIGADSLDQVEIVMAVEDEFTIEIPDEDVDKIETVGQVVDYVCTRLVVA